MAQTLKAEPFNTFDWVFTWIHSVISQKSLKWKANVRRAAPVRVLFNGQQMKIKNNRDSKVKIEIDYIRASKYHRSIIARTNAFVVIKHPVETIRYLSRTFGPSVG